MWYYLDMDEMIISLRLPKPLHRALKLKAVKNVRSLNGEIVAALQRYVTGSQAAEQAQIDIEEDATVERFGNYRQAAK